MNYAKGTMEFGAKIKFDSHSTYYDFYIRQESSDMVSLRLQNQNEICFICKHNGETRTIVKDFTPYFDKDVYITVRWDFKVGMITMDIVEKGV